MDQFLSVKAILGSFIYSVIGIFVLVVSFVILDKATPGELWKELIEERNVALAILFGAVALGISVIISGAIHG